MPRHRLYLKPESHGQGSLRHDRLDATAAQLAAASGTAPDDHEARDLKLRRQLNECDAKLSKYRALLEHDSDITIAATWIAEIKRERRSLERELGRKPTPRKLTENGVKVRVAAGAPHVLRVGVDAVW